MLTIILVDTALEIIPHKLDDKLCVTQSKKRFGAAGELLDTTLHYSVMKDLPNQEKRGRPDILQHYLLDTLGSPANLEGKLQIYFTTPQKFYRVASETRCPRDYLRFKSLMRQLLELDHVPPDPPFLISTMDQPFNDWIKSNFTKDQIWKLTRQGESCNLLSQFQQYNFDQPLAVLIGGFQKGSYSPEIEQLPGKKYSIYPQGLDSWIVINRVLSAYEQNFLS
jgi:rRNA small subunit pseudouridine methyltransferase Nep1